MSDHILICRHWPFCRWIKQMSRFPLQVLHYFRHKNMAFPSFRLTKIVCCFHIMSLPCCDSARNANWGPEVNLHSFSAKKQRGSSFAKFLPCLWLLQSSTLETNKDIYQVPSNFWKVSENDRKMALQASFAVRHPCVHCWYRTITLQYVISKSVWTPINSKSV